jgi:leucyl aminopeptidase (aminopeptidase T)
MAVYRWGQWGEAIMRIIVEAKAGENLLVLADTWVDMEIAEAVFIAAMNAKTNAQLLVIPIRSEIDNSDVSPVTAGAILGSDVIVGLAEKSLSNMELRMVTQQARANGTRMAQTVIIGVEDWVIEGLIGIDYADMIEVAKRVAALWRNSDECRVTSGLGTDVSFKLGDRPCLLGDGRAIAPGQVGYFPGATPSIAPLEQTINGTIVVDGATTCTGVVNAPITLKIEKGVITDIDGGRDAVAFRTLLESVADLNAFNVVHFNVGVNPRGRFQDSIHQDEQALGTVTFGFGHQDPSFGGSAGSAKIHSDVVLRSPTVYVDGVVLCKDNQLNMDLLSGSFQSAAA